MKTLFLACLFLLPSPLSAGEIHPQYELIQGKLFFSEIQIPTSFTVLTKKEGEALEKAMEGGKSITKEEEEALMGWKSTYLRFYESPNQKWLLITIEQGWHKRELWLIDQTDRANPIALAPKANGKHLWVHGIYDDLFILTWGGMGYATSEFIRYQDATSSKLMDDLLHYDPTTHLYVSLSKKQKESLEVGRLFSEVEPEFCPLHHTPKIFYDQFSEIEKVTIENQIIFTHWRDGKTSQCAPKLLHSQGN